MTILAIVNANQEGRIESKMMKSRQLEEIREARRKEADVRQQQKNSKLVCCRHLLIALHCSWYLGGDKRRFTPEEEAQI